MASSSSVICSVQGLVLPSSSAAAKDDLVISTFDGNAAALETMAGLSLSAVFVSVATSVSMSISSTISNHIDVVLTVSFISPSVPNAGTKNPIKVISLTGLYFHSFAGVDSAKCFHQNGPTFGAAALNSTATALLDPKTLVITFSGADSIASSGFSITCSISGFKNIPVPRISDLSVGLSTWDAQNLPLDTASRAAFPNIFAFSASNVTIALSSQIIQKTRVSMTLKFTVPFMNQAITTITVSGLPFSAPLQIEQPSAQCSVDSSGLVESKDPVPFNFTDALAELTMSFETGLPVGSGSYGVGALAVTCRISKLVNVQSALAATSSVSLLVFGNSLPLYFHSGSAFPAIFEQSLGFKRPRVSTSCF